MKGQSKLRFLESCQDKILDKIKDSKYGPRTVEAIHRGSYKNAQELIRDMNDPPFGDSIDKDDDANLPTYENYLIWKVIYQLTKSAKSSAENTKTGTLDTSSTSVVVLDSDEEDEEEEEAEKVDEEVGVVDNEEEEEEEEVESQPSTSEIRPGKRSHPSDSSTGDEKRRRVSNTITYLQDHLRQYEHMLIECNGIDDDIAIPIQRVLDTTQSALKKAEEQVKHRTRTLIKRLEDVYLLNVPHPR